MAQKSMGRIRMLSFLNPSKGIRTDGHTGGAAAGTKGRGSQEGSHPEALAQGGCRRQCGWALDLRFLVKRFLISAMVAWGST